MQYTIPHYFDRFRCTAAECEDTCCAGWAIMIDDDSLEKYREAKGDFGNRLRNSIDWEKGSFCQYEGRCAFLNEDNLCDLHMEAGEKMLCDTCRDYPRHMEEFEGLREGSLSLSCIEAAKIILGCRETVRFITMEDDIEDEEYEDYDYLLFTKLMDAREKILAVLQNRSIDIMTRMALVLDVSQKLQTAVDADETFKIDEILDQFGEMDMLLQFQQDADGYLIGETEYCASMRKIFKVFYKLEVLKADWPEYVKKTEMLLYGEGQKNYTIHCATFDETIGLKSVNCEEWSIWMEQLMVYFVFTYFCGAVYDRDALGKIKTSIVTTLLIRELAIGKWLDSEKTLNFDMFVDLAHRVSRELEHSDINLTRMEKMCNMMPIFQTEQLMRMLLY